MNVTLLDVVRMLFVSTLSEAMIVDASKNSEVILSSNVSLINRRLRTFAQRNSVALMQFANLVSVSVNLDILEMPMTSETDASLLHATIIWTAATTKSV